MEPWDDQENASFDSIAGAASPLELKQCRIAWQTLLLQQLNDVPIEQWLSRTNRMHDAVAERAVRLCEAEMIEAGYGPPPCAFSFVVFGSAGRREAILWSDQDNGLLIEGEPSEAKRVWFGAFGRKLSDLLETLGYEKCSGKVMCSEPMWARTMREWKEQLDGWAAAQEWEPVRYLIIASDMRHVAGSERLAEEWREYYMEGFLRNPGLHTAVLRNTVRHKATLNLLGQVLTERFGDHAGGFDVKYGVYIPLVNSVRQEALRSGIRETSTLGRLEQLGAADRRGVQEGVRSAFLTALRFRAGTPYETKDGLLVSSDYMPQSQLKNKQRMSELRDSLLVVRRIHRALQRRLRQEERRQ